MGCDFSKVPKLGPEFITDNTLRATVATVATATCMPSADPADAVASLSISTKDEDNYTGGGPHDGNELAGQPRSTLHTKHDAAPSMASYTDSPKNKFTSTTGLPGDSLAQMAPFSEKAPNRDEARPPSDTLPRELTDIDGHSTSPGGDIEEPDAERGVYHPKELELEAPREDTLSPQLRDCAADPMDSMDALTARMNALLQAGSGAPSGFSSGEPKQREEFDEDAEVSKFLSAEGLLQTGTQDLRGASEGSFNQVSTHGDAYVPPVPSDSRAAQDTHEQRARDLLSLGNGSAVDAHRESYPASAGSSASQKSSARSVAKSSGSTRTIAEHSSQPQASHGAPGAGAPRRDAARPSRGAAELPKSTMTPEQAIEARLKAKEWQFQLKQEARSLEREIKKIQMEEAKLKKKITVEAQKGNVQGAQQLARTIVRSRKAVERLEKAQASTHALGLQLTTSIATMSMQSSLRFSTEVMQQMNEMSSAGDVSQVMESMRREMDRGAEADELIEEAFHDDDLEAEAMAEAQKVLEEMELDRLGVLNGMGGGPSMATAPHPQPARPLPMR